MLIRLENKVLIYNEINYYLLQAKYIPGKLEKHADKLEYVLRRTCDKLIIQT